MADSAEAARQRWQRRYEQSKLRDADFTTLSGLEVEPVYGPPPGAVVPGFERIGWPGEYPFTRGLYPAGPGRSGSSPGSATPGRPTSATRCCWAPAGPGSQSLSTCQR